MLTANVGWIFIIQVIISVVILLWSYDRYAKRWGTTLGNHSVEGTYTRVDYVPQDFGGYIVTYGYTVNGKRYFGSIEWSILHFGLLSPVRHMTLCVLPVFTRWVAYYLVYAS